MVITHNNQNDSLFDSKIESIVKGMRPEDENDQYISKGGTGISSLFKHD